MPTLHIIDGHSQVFRAYHAIRGGLSTSTGIPTNAIHGFFMSLNVFLRQEKPTHLLVTFDAGHDERTRIYPAYKSNRSETPEDLVEQMPWIQRVLSAMGVAQMRMEGQEADDLIGTVAQRAREKGFEVAILSNDKDLFQLVDDHVSVLRTAPRGGVERFGPAQVRAKMGVTPEQIIDLLGLMGDSVDCIPGVPGVGSKTAVKLLGEHGDMESVIAAAESIKQPKLKANLIEKADQARLSKELATIMRDLPVEFDPSAWEFKLTPSEELTSLLRELELRALLEEWGNHGSAAPASTEAAGTETDLIVTEQALKNLVKKLSKAPLVSFDTETTSVDAMRAELVGISLSCEAGKAAYVPVGHTDLTGMASPDQLSLETVRKILGPVLANPEIPLCGHHLKYDFKVLRRHGFTIEGMAFDTLLASYCLNPERRGHGLKVLSLDLLGVEQRRIEDLIGEGKDQMSFALVAFDEAADYAGQDADLTLRLAALLKGELEKANLLDLFLKIEMPLIEVLADMEMSGVCINTDELDVLRKELEKRLTALKKEIHNLAGHPFNIGSTSQLRAVLFDELKLPVLKKGKTGPSTDVNVLEALAAQHPLPDKILEHRSVEKLLSTYVDALPKLINPQTGRIHTHFNQTIAATGRLSSSDPNLQNIPVRSEMGRRIRAAFHPSERDHVFLAADYSQIELRIAAHLSGDPVMVEAFTRGDDIHTATAATVNGIDPSDVTSAQREAAKRVSFGILYGISAHRLSQELKIPRAEAQGLIDQHFEKFAGLKAWIEKTLEQAREKGFVNTITGRRRFVPDIGSKNFNLRSAAERIAVNTPVQGSAADMIKIAMRMIAERLQTSDLRAKMVLQIHDELIFDLPSDEVDSLRLIAVETMADALPLTVPVVVDVAVGSTWAEC